ncbi:hypothetical protein NX862_10995 [Rhodobacter sp. KR11]|uniref:hypothetical protein n=1 Tax=Rhodobacter sp. KR11 TaxID=2974588 RepID=UPI002221A721|nr:hypothetical protein [Rhodobacter sp. KR11]MCW1919285.1 hypothetical protein [Rhodobacter sp. KR11]
MTLIRAFALLAGLFTLAACDAADFGDPPKPMGKFEMGLNVVVGETAQTVPISRQATPEEWEEVMKEAMVERFGSYEGGKLFDFGISIDGFVLAPPGVPVVASPRSALIITVSVWDDAKQLLLVDGGKRITVLEGTSGETLVGSGWTQNKKAQMKKLARNAAKAVQDYMLEHPEWLEMPTEEAAAAAGDVTVEAPKGGKAATPAPAKPAVAG